MSADHGQSFCRRRCAAAWHDGDGDVQGDSTDEPAVKWLSPPTPRKGQTTCLQRGWGVVGVASVCVWPEEEVKSRSASGSRRGQLIWHIFSRPPSPPSQSLSD